MNRKEREEARARYSAERQKRRAAQAQQDDARARREAALAKALGARPQNRSAWAPDGLREVLRTKAPRLLMDARYQRPLQRLVALEHVRSMWEWVPRGKGCDTLYRSLAAHLLAQYPTPAIVWSALFADDGDALVPMAVHVARGGSLYEHVKTDFPIPLTRKMCHELLATPADYSLLEAIRLVQARAAGADRRFFEAWRATRYAARIGSPEEEAFWFSVVSWFAKVPMLDPREVGPLFDYIDFRRRDDPRFTMKGRSALALLRSMREWHGDLTKMKEISGTIFARSGFVEGEYVDSRREPSGAFTREVWRIREVLTARRLAEEGKQMGHCVYSYAWRIEKGDTSIWSVQMEDGCGETGNWHMATVEVRNDLRRVVQAKGRFNRAVTPKEVQILRRWAAINGLTSGGGGAW